MRIPNGFAGALSTLLAVLFALWVLYLAYKVAVHVDAWPFGH